MKRVIIALGLVLILIFINLSLNHEIKNLQSVTPVPILSPTPTPLPLTAEQLMHTINAWRYAQGLQPYTKNDLLCNAAQIRVKEIQKDWSHAGFSIHLCGEIRCYIAENLVRGFPSAASSIPLILDAWLASASHAANLKANYQYSCIACENGHCVQEFGNF